MPVLLYLVILRSTYISYTYRADVALLVCISVVGITLLCVPCRAFKDLYAELSQ
jgi:hypothetical protein